MGQVVDFWEQSGLRERISSGLVSCNEGRVSTGVYLCGICVYMCMYEVRACALV